MVSGTDHRNGPLTLATGGVRMALRVTPKAAADRIGTVEAQADGARALKVAVTAVPENGKANAAVIRLLAKAWGMPQKALSIVAGSGGRRKVLFIAGDAATLAPHLEKWFAEKEVSSTRP